MSRKQTRRRFMQTTAALGVGYWAAGGISPRVSLSANEEIRFASVGVGGKGSSDSSDAARSGKMVAIVDIDDLTLGKAGEKFEGAQKFNDYRKMLDEMPEIDGVVIGTPDHLHACIAMEAMRRGKHVYCEKPLTHTPWEARVLTQAAGELKVATQMGNQGQASEATRRLAEMIADNAIGPVREVHVWTDRPSNGLFNEYWPQGVDRPADFIVSA